MRAFEIPKVTEVLLTHVNLRKEFHGDVKVQAIDLNFTLEGANELLDWIDPSLRTMLYFNRQAKAGQVDLPDVLAVLPDLRAPKLNGQKFRYGGNDKYKGYRFHQDFGLGGPESNLDFHNASVGKYFFETREGGTVLIGWQVSYAGEELTDDAITRLVRSEGEKVFIELHAPEVLQLVKGGKTTEIDPAGDGGSKEGGDLLDETQPENGQEDPNAVAKAFIKAAQEKR